MQVRKKQNHLGGWLVLTACFLTAPYAALADPTRRSILERVGREGGATVNELVAVHGLSQPAISRHLKVLEQAGLLQRGRSGTSRPCYLSVQGMLPALHWMERFRDEWEQRFSRIDDLIATGIGDMEVTLRHEGGQDET